MSTNEQESQLASLVSSSRFAEVRWVEETGSTNADLMKLAVQDRIDRVRITDFQSAGRGRKQRTWDAPPRSALLMSLLVHTDQAAVDAHHWTTAMGVAAAGACAEVAAVEARVKWPNDLVVNDRKLAGVLAESVLAGNRMIAVVVGIGINVTEAGLPPEIAARATSLEAERSANHLADPSVDRVRLASAIINRFDAWSTATAEDLHEEMMRHSATLGRLVRVELQDESVVGTVTAIDPDGRLALTADDGDVRRWAAGDVTHLRAQP